MRSRSLAVAILSLTLASSAFAAGKKSSSAGSSKGKSKGGTSSTASGHRKDDLAAAKDMIKPFQPWDDSYKKVSDKVGSPDKVDGDKNYWYALEADGCSILEVDKMGDSVGTMSLNSFAKGTPQFAQCSAKK